VKVGEVWLYRGDIKTQWEHYVVPISPSSFDNIQRENFVKILNIYKDGAVLGGAMPYLEVEVDDFIEFQHLESGALGILSRGDFVDSYQRIYNYKEGDI